MRRDLRDGVPVRHRPQDSGRRRSALLSRVRWYWYYSTAIALIFSEGDSGLGWGWELITLLEGAALAAYAALRLEPGPGYLAFFVLPLFGSTAAVVGGAVSGGLVEDGDLQSFDEPSVSLVGWRLVLAILTVVAAFVGLRRQVAAKS